MTLFQTPQPFDGNAFGTTRIEQQRDELLAVLKALFGDDVQLAIGGNPNVVQRLIERAHAAIANAEATHV
jgi:hypothetical protein